MKLSDKGIKIIRNKRINKGITQEELARYLKIDSSFISKLENKRRRNLSLKNTLKLCNLLELNLKDIINIKDYENIKNYMEWYFKEGLYNG